MSPIENTSTRDPHVHVLGAMSEGSSDYITGMESDGQRQLVANTQLPVEGPWDQLLELGFTRGPAVAGDPLFCDATLPAGWTKRATNHSMHSEIVDERGIARVSIFYKAAFYDRRADFHVVSVGSKACTDAVWGDGPVDLPNHWDSFTAQERADYRDALLGYIDSTENDKYASKDRLPRARDFLAAVPR